MTKTEALTVYREYCAAAAECRDEIHAPAVRGRLAEAMTALGVTPAELDRDCVVATNALLDAGDLTALRLAHPRVFGPVV